MHNLGICLDCNGERLLEKNGTCSKCGSESMLKQGAVRELQMLIEEKLSRPLVIYHANCRDGFCAAWVFSLFGDREKTDFHAAQYGEAPPDVFRRKVYILDFSYKKDVLLKMCAEAEYITILDHHKTAQEDLNFNECEKPVNLEIHFDMNRSGAGITWDFLADEEAREVSDLLRQERSWVVNYVEDRDLWKFTHPNSRLVNYYLSLIPFDFEEWDHVSKNYSPDKAAQFGDIIEQKVRQYCTEVSKNTKLTVLSGLFGNQLIPVLNAPQCDISELLEFQMEKYGTSLSVGWWQRNDGVFQYSLRSKGDIDVSAIARQFGGGGHKNAAGFEVKTLIHNVD